MTSSGFAALSASAATPTLLGDGNLALPSVAVLICVHAGADPGHFGEAIASIRAQSHRRLFVYLYCDGPLTPAHEVVLDRLDIRVSQDVVLRGASPIGLAGGLNILIEHALARPDIAFMARMDADDISLPERIARQVEFFWRNPNVDVAGTWCVEFASPDCALFHKRMPVGHDELLEFMLYRSPFNHPSVMFRRNVLDRGFRYDPTLRQMQDYDLWARLVRAGVIMGNLPEFLLWFRIDENFYTRRAGLDRARREIAMRISYARSVRRLRWANYPRYAALFLLRIAPAWAKKFGYKYLRMV